MKSTPINDTLLARLGLPMQTSAFRTAPPPISVGDFGVKMPKPKSLRNYDSVTALKMFSPQEAVKMNYIPQMLIALALDQTAEFVNYCRDNKLKEFLKHTRLMEKCVTAYAEENRRSLQGAFVMYRDYVAQYIASVKTDLAQTWWTIRNVANKKMPDSKYIDVATHVTIIHELLNKAERLDQKADLKIIERMKEPVHRQQNDFLLSITCCCYAIEIDCLFSLAPDKDIDNCINVLANRASFMAEDLVNKELSVAEC